MLENNPKGLNMTVSSSAIVVGKDMYDSDVQSGNGSRDNSIRKSGSNLMDIHHRHSDFILRNPPIDARVAARPINFG